MKYAVLFVCFFANFVWVSSELFRYEEAQILSTSWTSKTTKSALSHIQCSSYCSQPGCSAFAYDKSSHTCELGRKSNLQNAEVNADQTNVKTVHKSTTEPWHMILGGYKGGYISKVEIFNWQTGEQCFIEPTLKGIAASAGALFEGVPVYCGGDYGSVSGNECYKYSNHSWHSMNNLTGVTKFHNLIVVPNRGLYSFGGLTSPFINSLRLPTIDGNWVLGPYLYKMQNDNCECVLQINEYTTAFLGGALDKYKIVTYDWNLNIYTANPQKLNGPRYLSPCAIIQNLNGDMVVAIVGMGMEIWNPQDGSAKIISNAIPPEL